MPRTSITGNYPSRDRHDGRRNGIHPDDGVACSDYRFEPADVLTQSAIGLVTHVVLRHIRPMGRDEIPLITLSSLMAIV